MKTEGTILNGLVEVREVTKNSYSVGNERVRNLISVNDEGFESSLSFDMTKEAFKEAFNESPEYFSNKIIVSINHLIGMGELEEPEKIVKTDLIEGIAYMTSLVNRTSEWKKFSTEEQIDMLGQSIKATWLES